MTATSERDISFLMPEDGRPVSLMVPSHVSLGIGSWVNTRNDWFPVNDFLDRIDGSQSVVRRNSEAAKKSAENNAQRVHDECLQDIALILEHMPAAFAKAGVPPSKVDLPGRGTLIDHLWYEVMGAAKGWRLGPAYDGKQTGWVWMKRSGALKFAILGFDGSVVMKNLAPKRAAQYLFTQDGLLIRNSEGKVLAPIYDQRTAGIGGYYDVEERLVKVVNEGGK